ncbi:MAG: hypothetical protein R3D57_12005 [Hyphomicrobiaceae bacterium]
MILTRILNNALAIVVEIALIAGVAWLGYTWPLGFAVLTGLVSFGLGLYMEIARVTFELPFYFRKVGRWRRVVARLVAAGEASFKALVAGLVGLLTFLGTDEERLLTVAILFGVVTFAGAGLLRRLSLSFGVVPSRWGYFRLAAPLGVLFSLCLSFWPAASLTSIGYEIFNLPQRPSLEKVSELLFTLKQKFDELVIAVLSGIFDPELARIAGAFLSVNVLTGFVIALYAVAVSEIGRLIEDVPEAPARASVAGRGPDRPPPGLES